MTIGRGGRPFELTPTTKIAVFVLKGQIRIYAKRIKNPVIERVCGRTIVTSIIIYSSGVFLRLISIDNLSSAPQNASFNGSKQGKSKREVPGGGADNQIGNTMRESVDVSMLVPCVFRCKVACIFFR